MTKGESVLKASDGRTRSVVRWSILLAPWQANCQSWSDIHLGLEGTPQGCVIGCEVTQVVEIVTKRVEGE